MKRMHFLGGCAFHQNYYITRAVINVSTQTVDIGNNLPHLTFD